jgi:hypothetical protein
MIVILIASVAHAFPASLPNTDAPSPYTSGTAATTLSTDTSNDEYPSRAVGMAEEKQLTMNMCSIIYRIVSTSSGTHHQRRLSLEAQQEVLEKCLRWRAYIPYSGSNSPPKDPYPPTSDGGELHMSTIAREALEELQRIGISMEKEELDARRLWGGWFGYDRFSTGREDDATGYLLLFAAGVGVFVGWCAAFWSSSHEMLKGKFESTVSLRRRRARSEKNSSPAKRLLAIIKE